MSNYEELLIKIANYCQNNYALMMQIKNKLSNANKSMNNDKKLDNNSRCVGTFVQRSKYTNCIKMEWS